MGRCWIALVASVVMLVSVGCSDDHSALESAESASIDIGELTTAGAVVSGVDGHSWIVGYTDTEPDRALYRFSGGRAERVVDLAQWDQGVDAIAFDRSVVVGGVRCTDAGCKSTVLELLSVDPDGRVTEWGAVGPKAGPPDDSTSVHFLGRSASTLWVTGLDGRLLAFDAAGDVVSGPIDPVLWTDRCVIGSDLYRVELENPPPPPPPGVPVEVTTDPKGFSVSRWDGSKFVAVLDGRLPATQSPGSNAFCAHDGFEVPGPTATARWKPGHGWQTLEPVSAPSDARTGLTQSSSHRWYVVDAAGVLLELSDTGPVELGLEFTLRRGDEPPLGLRVDDANDQLVACIITRVDLECRATPT